MDDGVKSPESLCDNGPGRRMYIYGAAASIGQLGWGIYTYRKGFSGDSHFMPFKAFAVASLFVGALATASATTLSAFGIQSVNDAKEVGTNIRTGVGIQARTTGED